MSIVLFCLGWAVLLSLLWGASTATGWFLALKPCFAPIVTICTISITVYFGGLLGILRPVTYLLVLFCAMALATEANRLRKSPLKWRGIPAIQGLFLLGTLAFGLILSQETLIHYDNFTHWGLVVKEMLITHSFPTAESVLIEFTNYPTGTASWIYFVCTLVGGGENSMIMAQGLLIFAALYAVFGIIEERGRFLLVLTVGTGLSLLTLFNFAIRINDLLVDFVLPVLTLSAIALIYRHRRAPNTALIAVVPILGLLVVVKSTGVIFASVAICYLVYTLVKFTQRRGERPLALLGKGLLSIGLCFLPLVGWNIRMATVFAGVSNKFETNLSVVSNGYGGKTAEEIQFICRLFWDTVTDLSQRATLGVLFFQISAIIACIIASRLLKRKWALPRVLVAMDLVLVGYLLGILAMYIFSMPMEEAIYLAAFDRYTSSIVVLFGGVLTICLAVDMEASFHYRVGEVEEMRSFKSVKSKKIYLQSCVACIVLMAIVLTSEYNGMVYQQNLDGDSLTGARAVLRDSWEPEVDEARYLVLASDENGWATNYYTHYVAKYYLRASTVDVICLFYEDNFLNLLSQYDFLVIIDTSSQAQDLMERYLGCSGQPGIYDLAGLK